jgi:glucose/arabinose dehydrogenase
MQTRHARFRSPYSLLAAAALAVAPACGSDDAADLDGSPGDDASPGSDAAPADPDAGPPAAGCTPTSTTDFALELVTDEVVQPVFVTAPPDDPRLFIIEQPGRIRIVEDGQLLEEPFLDITDRITTAFAERGRFGLAFHPDYAQNGRLFVNYTASEPADATIVAEYAVSSDANVADGESEQRLLTIEQAQRNHNGGMIEFGPDGYLYIGMGDEGGSNDEEDNAQDLTTLHGAMLRIDVDDGEPYGIPADNPFVGDGNALDEIWAYGLRNPWRWSFDRVDERIYIADVGQLDWEEVNAEPIGTAGVNYGWPCYEGTNPHDPRDVCGGIDDGDLTDPVHEYENTGFGGDCAITGGYVYRGECLEALEGRYLFGDYCSSRLWSFELAGGGATDVEELTSNLDPDGALDGVSSFGEDAYGELYITSLGSGQVFRIVAAE